MVKQNTRKQKWGVKEGKKDDKTPPAKSMDDMTNGELNALLIPGNSILADDYGMEWFMFKY